MIDELDLSAAVDELIDSLSENFVRRFIALLREHERTSEITSARIMREVLNDAARDRLCSFMRLWDEKFPTATVEGVAFGLECGLMTSRRCAGRQEIDIVWSGPNVDGIPVRKGAAVLLELINAAQREIIVISFAAFRIPDAIVAFRRASERGVSIIFVLESPEDSGGRYKQVDSAPLGSLHTSSSVRFYNWPLSKRPPHALLHAKAVLVDGAAALVTSANLTENAISANMEIGVLIKGGDAPARVRDCILKLIAGGVLQLAP